MRKKYTTYDDAIVVAAQVDCDWDGHVYYRNLKVQFPRHLRRPGKKYTCDLAKVFDWDGETIKYYRAVKGTIVDRYVETIQVVHKRRVG